MQGQRPSYNGRARSCRRMGFVKHLWRRPGSGDTPFSIEWPKHCQCPCSGGDRKEGSSNAVMSRYEALLSAEIEGDASGPGEKSTRV